MMDGHISDIIRMIKNGQNSDPFSAHFEQHFNYTTSSTDLLKYMAFKVENQLNYIDAMKIFTKPKYSLCMEEYLTIIKKDNGQTRHGYEQEFGDI